MTSRAFQIVEMKIKVGMLELDRFQRLKKELHCKNDAQLLRRLMYDHDELRLYRQTKQAEDLDLRRKKP